MFLLPIQVKLLQEEYNTNSEEIKSLVSSEKGRLEGKTIRAENGETYDEQAHLSLINLNNRNNDIMYILSASNILDDYDENQISFGSVFNVCFIDDMEEVTYILIETRVSTEGSKDGFVTLNSEFGSAVYRKRVNETFAYKTNSNHLLSGIVTKIYTKEEQEAYLNALSEEHKKYYI